MFLSFLSLLSWRLTGVPLHEWLGVALLTLLVVYLVIHGELPNALTPESYLKWHSVHETSSTLTMVSLGLHLALNWSLITAGLRRVFRAAQTQVPTGLPQPEFSLRHGLRRLAWIVVAAAVLTATVWQGGVLMPSPSTVMMYTRDGHMEKIKPPADLPALHPGTTMPSPRQGADRFILQFALPGAVAVDGRRVLKIRLR